MEGMGRAKLRASSLFGRSRLGFSRLWFLQLRIQRCKEDIVGDWAGPGTFFLGVQQNANATGAPIYAKV